MIPAESHPSWAKLVKGEIEYKFSMAAAGMLFFNLRMKYKKDPSRLKECIREARGFFQKYQDLLATDMKVFLK
jgi:hypothetical protein